MRMLRLLVCLFLLTNLPAAANNSASAPSNKNPIAAFGGLPLTFEANRGQTDSRVRFLSHGNGYTLFLTPTETVLVEGKTHVSDRGSFTKSLADSESFCPLLYCE